MTVDTDLCTTCHQAIDGHQTCCVCGQKIRQPKHPCKDWRDWDREDTKQYHAPHHYWRWDASNEALSTARLGQRMYTTACLLWATMHDAGLGARLASEHPNWSAICSYYSMVHALRMTWFVLYGGYPTGHHEMVRPFLGNQPARPDWEHGDLQSARANIYNSALAGAIREGLRAPELAEELPIVGGLLDCARKLRDDANYESLLLAHQYLHWSPRPTNPSDVDVTEQFSLARDALAEAASRAQGFACRILLAAFRDELAWFAPRDVFVPHGLLGFTAHEVDELIELATPRSRPLRRFEWWEGPFREIGARATLDGETEDAVRRLSEHRRFDLFGVKKSVMEQFRDKVSALRQL